MRDIHTGAAIRRGTESDELTWSDRYRPGIEAVREIFAKVWLWIIIGIAIGALIHGYVRKS